MHLRNLSINHEFVAQDTSILSPENSNTIGTVQLLFWRFSANNKRFYRIAICLNLDRFDVNVIECKYVSVDKHLSKKIFNLK